MSIADLPNILTATDNEGGVFEFVVDEYDSVKIRVMWVKMQELVNHINDLEEKLLSAEERIETEDIEEANKALKRGKFGIFDEVEGKSGRDSTRE
ncbi:hypothetical protein LCGC14_2035180 [marine sediment metagenome]|uniref:Uncharacterized protein n=1 Tax=marine sediment metagenome TaxID=412755 RepID=A0A0F9ETE4_9ZZZZ